MRLNEGSRLAYLLSSLQRSAPAWTIVALGLVLVILPIGLAVRPILRALKYLTAFWTNIPGWATTFLGLFVVVVVGGIVAWHAYLAFESFVLFLAFGRPVLWSKLRALARQDSQELVNALEIDQRPTRPYAVVLAIPRRLITLPDLIRRLRNFERNLASRKHREVVDKLRRGWQEGVDSQILLRRVATLQKLSAPSADDRLLGAAVAANVTYLFGNLLEGRRLADQTMIEAERCDGTGLPVYQWLASYAHANSRLFLGQFHEAASLLGRCWHAKYVSLSSDERGNLFSELQQTSTVHPIASVPRHLILASAFAGEALRNRNTQPRAPLKAPLADDHQWVNYWYKLGQVLCRNEPISLHFTHAYMSLYCLVVHPLRDPLKVLERIPSVAPPVSQYVKDGVLGLYYLREQRFEEALEAFRRADSFSKRSGNRFLDGVFLPAHGAAAVHVKGSKDSEVREIGKRARARAKSAQSAFYDSLVDAFGAVVAQSENKLGKFNRLKSRAHWQAGGLVKIYGLADRRQARDN